MMRLAFNRSWSAAKSSVIEGDENIDRGRIVADRAYGSKAIRAYLRSLGIRSTIPWKSNQRRRGPFDQGLYRERNRVERTINRLKQCRRVATRYEKQAVNYLAMVTISSILLWL